MAGNDLSQSGKWRNFRYLVVAGQGILSGLKGTYWHRWHPRKPGF
jgi:hypothetical protein